MIPLKKLSKVRTIIVHGPCPDGYASAMILKHALPNVFVRFENYGAKFRQLAPEEHVLFCDIAPPEETAEAWLKAGALVLDHHVGVKDLVNRFVEADQGAYADEPGVSGAYLAYLHVWKVLRPMVSFRAQRVDGLPFAVDFINEADLLRDFATLAGVRDTWQTEHPKWSRACAQAETLMFLGPEQAASGRLPYLTEAELIMGDMFFERRQAAAARIARNNLFLLGRVAAFNTSPDSSLVSDVAEALRKLIAAGEVEGTPPAVLVGFRYVFENDELHLVGSLRAIDPSLDMCRVAQEYGGGGHRSAAGFSMFDEGGEGPAEMIWEAFSNTDYDDLVGDRMHIQPLRLKTEEKK